MNGPVNIENLLMYFDEAITGVNISMQKLFDYANSTNNLELENELNLLNIQIQHIEEMFSLNQ